LPNLPPCCSDMACQSASNRVPREAMLATPPGLGIDQNPIDGLYAGLDDSFFVGFGVDMQASKLLPQGLGTSGRPNEIWPNLLMQEPPFSSYFPNLDQPMSINLNPQERRCQCGNLLIADPCFCCKCGVKVENLEVKTPKSPSILSLAERLRGHGFPDENLQGAPPSPPSLSEAEKARPQRVAPKKRDILSQFAHHAGPVTTLMICNIPCRITQQQLIDVIDLMGFKERYDFIYLPTGGRSSTVGSSNLGYGFINFTGPMDADPFMKAFLNFQFEGTSSTKVCTVRPAHIQGLENNIVHFDRTAAKGRPRREGPFIRMSTKKDSPATASTSSGDARMEESLEEMDSLQGLQEFSCLEGTYFDFLEDPLAPVCPGTVLNL